MSEIQRLIPVVWESLSPTEKREALARGASETASEIASQVRVICDDVSQRGDHALFEWTERFDGVRLESLSVDDTEMARTLDSLDAKERECLSRAYRNIDAFHGAQRRDDLSVTIEPGVHCRRLRRPIDRVGLYVPGGSAPLVSTLLMLASPAAIAGCRERIVCTPPGKDGEVAAPVLAAAALCGVTSVFKVGGAQAVAALAWGTDTIPRVDKIFGPGNRYVTAAKTYVSTAPNGPAMDLPAGPSEVLVVADDDASPAFVASDLLSQAEHDASARVVLVALSASFVDQVREELDEQLPGLPRRTTAAASLDQAAAFVVGDLEAAIELANDYAPEHLILNCRGAAGLVDAVRHAGSVFVGPWSAEVFGDYASGTNHVLPTAGYARAYSGLSVESFEKTMTVQTLTAEGAARLAPTVERLASLEGLHAHAAAASLRRLAVEAGEVDR